MPPKNPWFLITLDEIDEIQNRLIPEKPVLFRTPQNNRVREIHEILRKVRERRM